MPFSKVGEARQRLPALANSAHSVSMSARVVVSSSEMQVLAAGLAQVDAGGLRAPRWRRVVAVVHDSVSKAVVLTGSRPRVLQALGQDGGVAATRCAMRVRPCGPVVHGVHAGDHRRQHLRRADVGGRLLAADVLLARLQREAVGGLPCAVDADAHQAARQRALERRGRPGRRRAGRRCPWACRSAAWCRRRCRRPIRRAAPAA
jgi:hypothetical protein